VLTEQLVKEGDTVAVGAAIARIDGAGAAAAPAAEAPAEQAAGNHGGEVCTTIPSLRCGLW